MAIIIIGTRTANIDVDEFLVKCPSCETDSWADVMIVSKYLHFYYVPIFPCDKEANIICNECGLKRYGRSFNSSLMSNYNEIKDKFRHPLYTYVGSGLISLAIIVIIIAAMLK